MRRWTGRSLSPRSGSSELRSIEGSWAIGIPWLFSSDPSTISIILVGLDIEWRVSGSLIVRAEAVLEPGVLAVPFEVRATICGACICRTASISWFTWYCGATSWLILVSKRLNISRVSTDWLTMSCLNCQIAFEASNVYWAPAWAWEYKWVNPWVVSVRS